MSYLYRKFIIIPEEMINKNRENNYWEEFFPQLEKSLFLYLKYIGFFGNDILFMHTNDYSMVVEKEFNEVLLKIHVRKIDLYLIGYVINWLKINNIELLDYYRNEVVEMNIYSLINLFLDKRINEKIASKSDDLYKKYIRDVANI